VCSSRVQPLHPRVDDVSCDAGKTEATALRMRQVQRRRGFLSDMREYGADSAVRVSNNAMHDVWAVAFAVPREYWEGEGHSSL